MSIIKPDAVREAVQSAGIKNLVLKDDVANSLAKDAEYRLREIVQEALKFKRHSRRRRRTKFSYKKSLVNLLSWVQVGMKKDKELMKF